MAFDAASGQLLLFGGENSLSILNDTWTWTGSTWRQLHPRHSPPISILQSLAYDPSNAGLLLFGGWAGYDPAPMGTWLWTGSDWTQLSPPNSPPLRGAASLGWDSSAKVLVLFGGVDAKFGSLSDTWIWTGRTWEVARANRSPERRAVGGQFAYDAEAHAFVLFGGTKGSGLSMYGDTWMLKVTA
jgi:hypothetical protein